MNSTSLRPSTPKSTVATLLGVARRQRFLFRFDSWCRKYPSLEAALHQARMPRRVYYRWRKGQVIPKETALRRLCLQTGIDIQYVLTGIPFRDEKCQLSLRYYQEQSQHAKTLEDRLHAFYQIAAQSYVALVVEFPKLKATLDNEPFPSAVFVNKVDELLRFEIAVIPKSDHTVHFELYRFEPLYPVPVCSGMCDEGTLLDVRRCMRERTRNHLKKLKEDDVYSQIIDGENRYLARHNAHHQPRRRRSRPAAGRRT